MIITTQHFLVSECETAHQSTLCVNFIQEYYAGVIKNDGDSRITLQNSNQNIMTYFLTFYLL